MAGTIVCGIEASDPARDAARTAGGLARALEARLVLVYAAVPAPAAVAPAGPLAYVAPYEPAAEDDAALALLRETAADAGVEGIAELQVEVGVPADELVRVARDEAADLLVVGKGGRGTLTSSLVGSVSRSLASRAPCPVVVTPPVPGELRPREPRFEVITCAVDETDGAGRALGVAHRLSERLHARLVLVHVLPESEREAGASCEDGWSPDEPVLAAAEELIARLERGHGVDGGSEHRFAFGDPADGVASVARLLGADLIVTGTRGRHPLRAALTGSVSGGIVERAPCPVAIVPPGAAAPASSRPARRDGGAAGFRDSSRPNGYY